MSKDEDDGVWTAYVKTVKPLGAAVKKKTKPASKPRTASPSPFPKIEAIPLRPARPDFHTPLDHNLEKCLRQGVVVIDARLDLHGMRQDEAHEALEQFIAQQVKAGKRCLLVITGKGRGGESVLRNNLGGWLEVSLHARHILALRPAAIKHGGAGAFYVLLKRRRD